MKRERGREIERERESALDRLVTIMADQVPTTLWERQTIRLSIQADLLARRLLVLGMRAIRSFCADSLGGLGGAEGK